MVVTKAPVVLCTYPEREHAEQPGWLPLGRRDDGLTNRGGRWGNPPARLCVHLGCGCSLKNPQAVALLIEGFAARPYPGTRTSTAFATDECRRENGSPE